MFIESLYDRGGAHGLISQQNTLDFNRRNPLPGRLETIIAAPLVPPETMGVCRVEIARAHPTIYEGFRALLAAA